MNNKLFYENVKGLNPKTGNIKAGQFTISGSKVLITFYRYKPIQGFSGLMLSEDFKSLVTYG